MDITSSTDLRSLYRELRPKAISERSWRSLFRPAVHLLRALESTASAVGRYGPEVSRTHTISIPWQAFKLLTQLRTGFTSDDFYRFRMYQLSPERASLFVPLGANLEVRSELYRKLALDAEALADKRRFGQAAASASLPVASTIADISDGNINWWADSSPSLCDLFVKEAASECGAGAMTWIWDGRGKWSNADSNLDAAALMSRLATLSAQAPLILQRRLSNHPDLVELGPQGLCTVRVVTLRTPAGGPPEILLAAFRMPTGGDIADNFARGGLACAVDLNTGRLGPAVRKDLASAHKDVHRHPDTCGLITGRYLPNWPEVLHLALQAHEAFPRYPSVGWDIAISSEGPILLEANYNWDVVLAQQAGSRPLGATKWPQHCLEWARWADSRRDGSMTRRPPESESD